MNGDLIACTKNPEVMCFAFAEKNVAKLTQGESRSRFAIQAGDDVTFKEAVFCRRGAGADAGDKKSAEVVAIGDERKTVGFAFREWGRRFGCRFEDDPMVRVIEENVIAGVDAFANGPGEGVIAVCAGSVGGETDGNVASDQAVESKFVDATAPVRLGEELVFKPSGRKSTRIGASELNEIVIAHKGRGEGHGVGGTEVHDHVRGDGRFGGYGNLRLEEGDSTIESDGNDWPRGRSSARTRVYEASWFLFHSRSRR